MIFVSRPGSRRSERKQQLILFLAYLNIHFDVSSRDKVLTNWGVLAKGMRPLGGGGGGATFHKFS